VGFAATLQDELIALCSDQGARSIIERHRDAVVSIDTSDPGCLRDIDRPSDIGR
jgi:molybdenum cofactor cytidylyltransferase